MQPDAVGFVLTFRFIFQISFFTGAYLKLSGEAMHFWIFISLAGLMLLFGGFIVFYRNYKPKDKIAGSTIILGILLPVFLAITYSDTLITMIPKVTMIDLGAFFITGMISGFFLAVLLIQKN